MSKVFMFDCLLRTMTKTGRVTSKGMGTPPRRKVGKHLGGANRRTRQRESGENAGYRKFAQKPDAHAILRLDSTYNCIAMRGAALPSGFGDSDL